MTVTGPHFEMKGVAPTFYVEFDDGLQVVFCPHTKAVPKRKLSFVLLRSSWNPASEYLYRHNLHDPDEGGKFFSLGGTPEADQYRRELGDRWLLAYDFLNPGNKSATERLTATQEQKDAWDYIRGSDVFARRLIGNGI